MNEITNRKRICIIRSNSVNPDSRVEKEALALHNAGYDVHILAWERDNDNREQDEFVVLSGQKIRITRLGHKATYGDGFKNLKPYLAFQFHMRKWLKKHNFDAIHACDFDTAFFSFGVAKSKRELFVFDIFDFLFGDPNGILEHSVKRAQLKLIDRSDATIICSEERRMQIQGSSPKKLIVIHNTPEFVEGCNTSLHNKNTGRIKIVYVGILQDFRLLKEIAEVVATRKDLELHVGGFGKYQSYFSSMSAKYDNIVFHGRLKYEDTIKLERMCDIMLAIYDPSIENHRFAAPNKFYESLMLGKPVVMVRGTGMSQIVSDNDLGVLIDYSKDGFIRGIDELISKRDLWQEMGNRMISLYKTNYNWSEMAKRLSNLYAELFEIKKTSVRGRFKTLDTYNK